MKKILLVAYHHGNEPLGEYVYNELMSVHPELIEFVDYIVANPIAKEENVRFTEKDMNRSYSSNSGTYEERRAAEVKDQIKKSDYALVIDFHNTVCVQEPLIIIPDYNQPRLDFIRHTDIEHIMVLKHKIADTSLIGVCEQAVAVEISILDNQQSAANNLANAIQGYFSGALPAKLTRNSYEVSQLLMKTAVAEATAREFINMKKHKLGYPLLVGENSYKRDTNYLGFIAEQKQIIEV